MLVHLREEVPHFQRPEVWKDDTVFDCLDRQSDCNDVLQQEVYQKIMHKHYLERIVVAQSIKVLILRHQVSFSHYSHFSHC